MAHTFTRRELYDLVWSEPTKKLAERFGISDVGLAKACKKAEIPLPPRGYWARKQAGQRVGKIDLPLRFPGASDEVRIGKEELGEDWQQKIIDSPVPPPPVFEEDLSSVKKRIGEMVGKVHFHKTVARPHPLIDKLLAQDDERRNSGHSWNTPVYDAPTERRWLIILNSVFLAAAQLGCSISMGLSKYGGTDRLATISVGDQPISFKLVVVSEGYEFEERMRPRKQHLRLDLMRDAWQDRGEVLKSWGDGKGTFLERRLAEILSDILLMAETRMRECAIRHHEWLGQRKARIIEDRRQAKIEAERKAKELREKQEKERTDRLLTEATALQQAETIRSYVAAIRGRSSEIQTPSERIERWATWALEQADRIDPIKSLQFLHGNESPILPESCPP